MCGCGGCAARTWTGRLRHSGSRSPALDRYQRRTTRLAGQAAEAVRRLAPRDGAGLLAALGIPLSMHPAMGF